MRRPTPGRAATTIVSMWFDHVRTALPAAPLLRSQVREIAASRAIVLAGRAHEAERAGDAMRDACYGVGPKDMREMGAKLCFYRWIFRRGER